MNEDKSDVIIGKTIGHCNGMIGFKLSFTSKTKANQWKTHVAHYFRMQGLNVEVEVNGYYDEKNVMA